MALVVRFAHSHRWPLRAGDAIEVWDGTGTLLGCLPADLILAILTHHLGLAAIQQRVTAAVTVAPVPGSIPAFPRPAATAPEPEVPPRVLTPEGRAASRARRRARS